MILRGFFGTPGALGGMREGSLRPKRPLGMALWHGKGKQRRIQHALAQRAAGLRTLARDRRTLRLLAVQMVGMRVGAWILC